MLKSLSKAAEQASESLNRGIMTVSADAEINYVKNAIDDLKTSFGREAFDLAAAGDLASVGNMVMARKPEMERLQAKLEMLQTKKATISGKGTPSVKGGSGGSSGFPVAVPTTQRMQVTVPTDVTPGSRFPVQLPNGQIVNVPVPPGAVAGQQIMVDVPSFSPEVIQAVAVV